MRHCSLWVGLLAVLCGALPASATTAYMQRLPTSTAFRCLNCHNVQDPPANNAGLNTFGQAFKTNGFQWNVTLASLSADGDNCTNGFELGDENGDGIVDANVTRERFNPGQTDCTLQITPQAWSALKTLFR